VKRENLLAREGQALCLSCHEKIARRLADKKLTVHAAVGDGQCGDCHAGHGAMAPALLKKDQPELCLECHEADGEKVRKVHGGYAVAEARCTGCHDPHASPSKKLIAENAHPPFGDRDCSTCHLPPGEKRGTARLKKDILVECDNCHDFAKRAAAVKVAHRPVKEGRCFECHTPHASAREHLLVESGGSLCWGCHEKTQKVLEQPFVHAPVKRGECTRQKACHTPRSQRRNHASSTQS
jgi:predicted CXXCH cytochrome family protein